MHINKFVPHYMQYQALSKQTINKFSDEYYLLENESISKHLIEFDRKLIEIFNFRKERFSKDSVNID